MWVKEEEKEEQDLFLIAKVITDETFSRHGGFDLAVFDESNSLPPHLLKFHAFKRETYGVFKAGVAAHFGYSGSQIRLWPVVNRKNKTVRVDSHIPEDEPSLSTLCSPHADHF